MERLHNVLDRYVKDISSVLLILFFTEFINQFIIVD